MLQRGGGASAWADVDDDEIARLIIAAEAQGLDRALEAYQQRAPFFVQRLRNTALGNWHVLLARPCHSRVLDVGCGFGALLAGLRSAYSHAFGMDVLRNRLRLAALRNEGPGGLLAQASGHALPFAAGSFDLVTLNGVLEWAAYYRDGDPRSLQLDFLREVRRILAAQGTAAVAIENRFALETLAGLPDTHTGLLLAPALPRWIAGLWSRVRGRGGYRTYLYSRKGYRSLFREAGWGSARVLDLAPSYNDYDFLIDASDSATYAMLWHHGLMRSFVPGTAAVRARLAAVYPRMLGSFGYAYLVLGGATMCVLDPGHALWAEMRQVGLDPGEARFGADMTDAGSVAIVVHEKGNITGVVFMARRVTSGSPLASLRSQRLTAHLDGRLRQLAELQFADYYVSAYLAQA